MEGLFDDLFRWQRGRDALAWLLMLYLGSTAVLIFYEGRLVWAGYAAFVFAVAALPTVAFRDVWKVPPVEVVFLATVPFTFQAANIGFVASHTLNYVSTAAVALLIISELAVFTSFRTTEKFTVFLLGLTTIALSGLWAIARWTADSILGTGLIASEELLMLEFGGAALAGLLAGVLFSQYMKLITRRRVSP